MAIQVTGKDRDLKISDTALFNNIWHFLPPIMPERFNSISMPVEGSIVPAELNSITEPKSSKEFTGI